MATNALTICLDRKGLITQSTAGAVYALIESGLPRAHAITKLGISKTLSKQIDKIATKFIDYYGQGEDVFNEHLERNTTSKQEYIKNCINFYISCQRADAAFAAVLTESIMTGVAESPELALKVAERRFPKEWAPKQQKDINVKNDTTVKTITIVQPNIETIEAIDVDYNEVDSDDCA